MDTVSIHPGLTVQYVLQRWPQSARIFVDFQAACVGCHMSRFCTLDDVAAQYGISPISLARGLRRSASDAHTLVRGVQNEIVP
jgi:hybrid cluster-associated redox disulfide protein